MTEQLNWTRKKLAKIILQDLRERLTKDYFERLWTHVGSKFQCHLCAYNTQHHEQVLVSHCWIKNKEVSEWRLVTEVLKPPLVFSPICWWHISHGPLFGLALFWPSTIPALVAFLVAQMVKNLPANAGDLGSISGLGGSPGEGHGTPLQYSCLENSMDREAWQS